MVELPLSPMSRDDNNQQAASQENVPFTVGAHVAAGMPGCDNDPLSSDENAVLLAVQQSELADAELDMAPPPWNLLKEGLPSRWSLAILSMFGFVFLYALRFNISQTLVAMTGNVTFCNDSKAYTVSKINSLFIF